VFVLDEEECEGGAACRGLLLVLDEEDCVEGTCNGNNQITPNEDWKLI